MASTRTQVPAELIERCKQGDADAFQELFEFTAEDVHRILYRLAGAQPDLEDLVQEVYLGLWRSLRRFRGSAAFSTYLYSVCIRTARKRHRGWFRFARLREAVQREPVEHDPGPEREAARSQQAEAVWRTLDGLSFKLRSVLVLYEMEGLSGKEIAAQLDIPEKTVWTRLHHARKAFQRSYPWREERNSPETASS
ncbi:MAG: RNA polymerase sigma factor [Deltaproteobacteria bacterium]|nr:RNA polymerase sigma factor [Deltaproteobacteria bacterium]